jgi:hypothetical protein
MGRIRTAVAHRYVRGESRNRRFHLNPYARSTTTLGDSVPFVTIAIWSAHVIVVFVWQLLPHSHAYRYVNALSPLRSFDIDGFWTTFDVALQASSCFGFALGMIGAVAANAALTTTRAPGRSAAALALNISIAVVVPVLAIVLG